jgi:uncharacterized protein (TIGR03067 family)
MCRFTWLLVLPLVWLTGGVCGQDSAKSDLKQFQGTWQPVFIRNPEGQQATAEELKAVRLVVKGNEFTFTNKDATISGTFSIDPSKTPKTIDFLLKGGKSDEKFLGVYEIRGERRLSCFALPKENRPKELRPTEKGYLLLEWKPAAQ